MGEKKRKWELFKKWSKKPLKAVHSFSGKKYKRIDIDTSNCPKYDEYIWGGMRRHRHNCYNYALNLIFNKESYLQPGELGFSNDNNVTPEDLKERSKLSEGAFKKYCNKVIELAQKDGLIWLGKNMESRPGYRLIALAMAEFDDDNKKDLDYHWYRQDNDGTWSHKPGPKSVRPLEIKAKFEDNVADIVYPHEVKADRGRYKDFMGYFLAPEDGMAYNKSGLDEAMDIRNGKEPSLVTKIKRKLF